ncbi:AAEL000204-PA [Aedes aegypti]|uniref:AAEL000204-PA n=1 Tax=Aedes aegypti TaxID=7159 RepID=Q17PV9_AEDAE|nr:AAEL000204-PA [Aedes aegypti]
MVLYAIIDRKGLFRDDAVEVVEAGWLKSIDRYANLCRYDPPEEISPPTNTEDPLKRIQEEINEVARREQELRQGHRLNDSNDDCLSSANSDDSGLSLSPSPVHSPSVSNLKDKLEAASNQLNGTNGHDSTTAALANGNRQFILPQSNALTRARSTPQLFQISPNRRFNVNPNQRGLMQKFIASRGRLSKLASNSNSSSPISNASTNSSLMVKPEQHASPIELSRTHIMLPPTAISTPPIIERDSNGKPIRRGYVPVEEKIQKELRDLKNRESELKRLRKQNRMASQSDLLELNYDSDSAEEISDDDNFDTNVYPSTRKLRSTKSIGELCEALTHSSLSPRETPSPQFENRQRGMRPAMSLAQLCDLDPQEAPSSHKLIAKWETLIQQTQQR